MSDTPQFFRRYSITFGSRSPERVAFMVGLGGILGVAFGLGLVEVVKITLEWLAVQVHGG